MVIQKDNLKVMIFDSREYMGNKAGSDAAECIRQLLSEKR